MNERTRMRFTLFWGTYFVGTLVFLFALQLSRVPRSSENLDYSMDYIFWIAAASMMLLSIFIAKRAWHIGNPFSRREASAVEATPSFPRGALVVVRLAWVEFAYSLLVIFSIVAKH